MSKCIEQLTASLSKMSLGRGADIIREPIAELNVVSNYAVDEIPTPDKAAVLAAWVRRPSKTSGGQG